jgi:pimeloyl-ACP methyl ester carboxylesterase
MNWLLGSALVLLGLALFTHIGAGRTERELPPVGEFREVYGLRMHYKEAGAGTPLVLIHGASTSLLDFDASILGPLSKHHRVIAVDRPGHGYSDRPSGPWPDPVEQARLIRGLLTELGVEDPLLVGHSWSGSVVLAYLLQYPEEASGGVLLAGGSHPWKGGVAWYTDVAGIPVLGQLFARTLVFPLGNLSLDGAVRSVFFPNAVPEGYKDRTGLRLSLRPEVFLANAEDVRLLSDFLAIQSRRYTTIEHPLLLLTGDRDEVVPAWNHADRLLRQAPNAKRVTLEETGHALHHARPDRVSDLIASFARRVTSPQDSGASIAAATP